MFAPMLHALVLLGCRIEPAGELTAAARRRALTAVRAFQDGLAPLVIVSGGRRWFGVSEAEALSSELERRGVPGPAIVQELRSLSTCENARNVARILAERNLRSVGLVTCDWHMPRALASFRRAGISAEPISAPSPTMPWYARVYRSQRERVSFVVDRFATWGWPGP
jgi:uncharacterized SAM-binding protein YcdF (DUF218 family)